MEEDDDVLVSEIARELNVSHVTVWRYINEGRLPARRRGPVYLVKRRDLDAFKATRRPPGRPKKPLFYPEVGEHAPAQRCAEPAADPDA